MTYNQWKTREGEVLLDGLTIQYKVVWVRDVLRDTVQLDEIESVTVYDTDGEEVRGYYQDHCTEIDDLVLEDAQKTTPDDWETPSWPDIQEARAEQERD